MVYPWAFDDRFNAAFPQYRGLTFGAQPMAAPPPTPVANPQTAPGPMPVIRANPDGTIQGNITDPNAGNKASQYVPEMPNAPRMNDPGRLSDQPAFGAGATTPPYMTSGDVPGQQGTSLTSTPVGGPIPAVDSGTATAKTPGFMDMLQNKDVLSGLDDVAKAFKQRAASDLTTINPSRQSLENVANPQLAAGLLAQLMAARRRY